MPDATTPTLPTPEPDPQDDALPYWEATKEHRLVLPRCTACDSVIWYPRGFCPACGSFDVEWFEAPGTGRVYSFSVARRGQGAYRGAAPYVLAYVELDLPDAVGANGPGPRVLTNIVDCDPDDVAVDDPVEVVFHDTDAGWALARFRPSR